MRLIFLIDIDTTMGDELTAVKSTVNATVDQLVGRDDIMQVDLVVIPFTEYGNGCIASIHEFSDPNEATTFTDGLELGKSATDPNKQEFTADDPDVTTSTSVDAFTGTGYHELVFTFQSGD
jgi:hypothetical protein